MARLRALAFGGIVAYLVVAPLFFSVVTIESFEFPKVLLLRTLGLALLAIGALHLVEWAARGQVGSRVCGALRGASRDLILLGAAAWLLAGTLSAATSLSPHVSLHGAHQSFAGLATLASYAVLFAAARSVIRSVGDLYLVLIAALAAGAGATAYGLIQLLGIDPIAWGNTPQSGGFERIASTMGNPNFLGGYLAMVFPVGIYLALHGLRRGARVMPIAIATALALSTVVGFATLSRGVAIAHGAGIGVLVLGWWRTGERTGVAWIAGTMLAFVLLGGVLVAGTEVGRGYAGRALVRTESTLNPQRDLRFEFWTAAISMYRSEPLLGVGLDAFQLAFPRHASPSFRRRVPEATPGRAHNELLHTAATQGTVGVAAGLSFLVGLLAGWRRALQRAASDEERMLLVAVGASLAALLARNLVSFTVVGMGGLACVMAGSLASRAYRPEEECSSPALSRRGERAALGTGIAIACMAFLASAIGALASTLAAAVSVTVVLAAVVGCIAFGALVGDRTRCGPAPVAGYTASGAAARGLRVVARVAVAAGFLAALGQTVLRPAAADLLARQGKLALQSEASDVAVSLFERAAKLDPGREIHWVELGIAHHSLASDQRLETDVRRKHRERAVDAHLRAATLVPGHVTNQANLGRGLTELGNWGLPGAAGGGARETDAARLRAEVYQRFDAALALDPFHRGVYFDATKAARGFRDEPALARYASAWSEHHPAHAQARAQLGIAAMMRSDWATAETELIAATKGSWARSPADEVGNWVNLSSTQLELAKASDALASSEAALGLVPLYLPALRARARAHEALAASADASQSSGENAPLERRPAIEHRRRAAADWATRLVALPGDSEAQEALARLKAREDDENTRAPGLPEEPES